MSSLQLRLNLWLIISVLCLTMFSTQANTEPSCGHVSISNLLWLATGDETQVAKQCTLVADREEMSFSELRDEGAKVGLSLVGVRASLAELADVGGPSIVQVDGDHFVVVEHIGDSYVRVMYGERKFILLSRSEFGERYNDYALIPSEFLEKKNVSPSVMAVEPITDIGKITADELHHTFTIRTDDSTGVRVKDIEACCGAEFHSINEMVFSAGQPLEVTFKFCKPVPGGELMKTVAVIVDKPRWPVVNLSVVGWVPGSPSIKPENVDFGAMKRGEKSSKQVFLRFVEPQFVNSVEVEASSDKISITKGDYSSKSETLSLTISFDSSALRGPISESVNVKVPTKDGIVEQGVPIYARVETPVKVLPSSFMFGIVNGSDNKTAKLHLIYETGFDVIDIRTPEPVTITKTKLDKGWELIATIDPKVEFDVIDSFVTVITNVADDKEIKIPVYAAKLEN